MISWKRKQVLILAPHVDDELNCAGLLTKIQRYEPQITILACSACEDSLPRGKTRADIEDEFESVCDLLCVGSGYVEEYPVRRLHEFRQEILERFVLAGANICPDVVICPSSTDVHQDHRVVYEEALRAFRNVGLLLGWESPNNQRSATVNAFVHLTPGQLNTKVEAWKRYQTQHHRAYFDEAFIRSLAVVRGKQCRSETGLAEGYEVISVKT